MEWNHFGSSAGCGGCDLTTSAGVAANRRREIMADGSKEADEIMADGSIYFAFLGSNTGKGKKGKSGKKMATWKS